jgi:hypothetical protein
MTKTIRGQDALLERKKERERKMRRERVRSGREVWRRIKGEGREGEARQQKNF